MSKNKPALPNLSINFDPLALMMETPAPAPAPASTDLTPGLVEETPAPAPAHKQEKKARKQSKGIGLRQRGLWFSDETMLALRIAALKRGMTASRLADEIICAAINTKKAG
jgi:hypothetical protein